MLQRDALRIVRKYVANLNKGGLPIEKAFLFGSYARNEASDNSDIDVLLVSELFDTNDDTILSEPWSPKYRTDFRIEPIAVGKNRFLTDEDSIILQIVRQEGLEVK